MKRKTNCIISGIAGATVSAAILGGTLGWAIPGQAKIDKYEYYDLANVICERISEDFNTLYDKGEFRLLTGNKNTPVSVYISAYQGKTPCFIRATMQNEDNKIYDSNSNITRYNIIENINNADLDVEITPTSEKIIEIINKLNKYETVLTDPEKESYGDYVSSYIGGYFFNQSDENNFDCNIVTSATTVNKVDGLLGMREDYYHYTKNVNFDVPKEILQSEETMNDYMEKYLSSISLINSSEVETSFVIDNFNGLARGNELHVKASNYQDKTEGNEKM